MLEMRPGWSHQQEATSPREQNAFFIWLRPTPKVSANFLLRAAISEYETFVNDGITDEELSHAAKYVSAQLSNLSTSQKLRWMTENSVMGQDTSLDQLVQQTSQVSKDEVNRVIKAHLDPQNIKIVAVVGKVEEFLSDIEGEVASIVYPLHHSEVDSQQAEEDNTYATFSLQIQVVFQRLAEGIFQ